MPQILIVTDSPENAGEVVYRERVTAVHLASGHSGGQLVERLAWAVDDAAQAEHRACHDRPVAAKSGPDLRAA
jgi:hypothetical protein